RVGGGEGRGWQGQQREAQGEQRGWISFSHVIFPRFLSYFIEGIGTSIVMLLFPCVFRFWACFFLLLTLYY
ncbi:hypothetical protein, partial [Mitsuokella multacida]|uniref:hypothetical protein n=1 Tax=Mitsuokella multacida TaxID=52226 RepID=UPI003FA2CAD7